MKTSLCRLLVILGFTFASSAAVYGHQDVLIQLQGDKLIGLPRRYEPATLNLRSFRIQIQGKGKEFSPFLKSLFRRPYDLELSASWYHERSILPPYLLVHISPKAKNYTHRILFDLDALQLIQVERVVRFAGGTIRHRGVPLSNLDISKAARARR